MPMQQPSRPNMGKGNYYPGMGYLPEARNEIGPDFFGGTSLGEPIGPDRREQPPPEPDPRGVPPGFQPSMPMVPPEFQMQRPAMRQPFMGGGYGLPFGGIPFGGMPFYGGMMQPSPFYGGLGGFLGGGFGGGPMYGGFRRRFNRNRPRGSFLGDDRLINDTDRMSGLGDRRMRPSGDIQPVSFGDPQPSSIREMVGASNFGFGPGGGQPAYFPLRQPEYTPPSQEAMTPLLEEFTNFYLDDFQKRNPPTQRSSTMRSTMSPYGIGSLFGGG